MKKVAILIAFLMLQFQLGVYAAKAKKVVKPKRTVKVSTQKKPTEKLYNVYDDNNYLLKYNIDDLDSAPWKNGGQRKL